MTFRVASYKLRNKKSGAVAEATTPLAFILLIHF